MVYRSERRRGNRERPDRGGRRLRRRQEGRALMGLWVAAITRAGLCTRNREHEQVLAETGCPVAVIFFSFPPPGSFCAKPRGANRPASRRRDAAPQPGRLGRPTTSDRYRPGIVSPRASARGLTEGRATSCWRPCTSHTDNKRRRKFFSQHVGATPDTSSSGFAGVLFGPRTESLFPKVHFPWRWAARLAPFLQEGDRRAARRHEPGGFRNRLL